MTPPVCPCPRAAELATQSVWLQLGSDPSCPVRRIIAKLDPASLLALAASPAGITPFVMGDDWQNCVQSSADVAAFGKLLADLLPATTDPADPMHASCAGLVQRCCDVGGTR